MTAAEAFGLLNYWVVVFLMMLGFYMVIARQNFIKKIIGLNIFQISVILMYITMGKVAGGTAPIVKPEIASRFSQHAHDSHPKVQDASDEREVDEHHSGSTRKKSTVHSVSFSRTDETRANASEPFVDVTVYSHPLPSVLMLTAIVVGVGTTALALALVVRIREDYGTIEEDEVLEQDRIS